MHTQGDNKVVHLECKSTTTDWYPNKAHQVYNHHKLHKMRLVTVTLIALHNLLTLPGGGELIAGPTCRVKECISQYLHPAAVEGVTRNFSSHRARWEKKYSISKIARSTSKSWRVHRRGEGVKCWTKGIKILKQKKNKNFIQWGENNDYLPCRLCKLCPLP